MPRLFPTVAVALALAANPATAGGIERALPPFGLLFEPGNHLQFDIARISPRVTGQQVPWPAETGDVLGNFSSGALALKVALGARADLAVVLNKPVGIDLAYPASGYMISGSQAAIEATRLTALLRWRLTGAISLIGGALLETASGTVDQFDGYRMRTETDLAPGAILGVAWERPDIAARVALIWTSAINHDFSARETWGGDWSDTAFRTTIPQSLTLEAQTGIAADTLVFGSVRWADWSAFNISTPFYEDVYAMPLADYKGDVTTFEIGLGRRFSDQWSGAVMLTHEPKIGGYSGNLGPQDGMTAITLAATRTQGAVTVTGFVRHAEFGDTATQLPGLEPLGRFTDDHVTAVGLRVGYAF